MKKNKTKNKSNGKIFLVSAGAIAVLLFIVFALFSKTESPTDPSEFRVDSALLIKNHSPIKGSANAQVTIVEFLDPECEACSAMYPIMEKLLAEYNEKVRLVIRYMPLHGNSHLAAVALEEARDLGKYDEAISVLFQRQSEWADHASPRPELITVFLKEIGIEEKNLEASYLLGKHKWKIDIDQADGIKLGVKRTPTFFVNGKMLSEIGYGPIRKAIDEALIR